MKLSNIFWRCRRRGEDDGVSSGHWRKGFGYGVVVFLQVGMVSPIFSQTTFFPFENLSEVIFPLLGSSSEAIPSGGGNDCSHEPSAAAGSSHLVSLQGKVWDMVTGQILPRVAIEVYQKKSDGRMMLAYTGRTPTGAFAIPLTRGVTHIIILNKTGFQPEAFYIAADSTDTQRFFYLKRRPAPPSSGVTKTVEETDRAIRDKASLPPLDESLSLSGAVFLPGSLLMVEAVEDDVFYEKGKVTDQEEKQAKMEALGVFELVESTSLRQGASHETEILLRLRSGNRVELLEKTSKYWWKVRFDHQEGYVKALLLAPLAQ